MPISSTSTSVRSGVLSSVVGKPCSLLKLRSFAHVGRPAASAAHARSFVEVFPTEPVTAMTGPANDDRCTAASAISPRKVSGTSMAVPPTGGRVVR